MTRWTQVSDTVYTAIFRAINNSNTNGVISIADGFTDSAGNSNADGGDLNNSLTLTIAPTAVIRTAGSSVQAGTLNKAVIYLSEGSNDFTSRSIETNVPIKQFRKVNESLYEITYQAPRIGKVNIAVVPGTYTDLGGVTSIAHKESLDNTTIDVIRTSSITNQNVSTRSRGAGVLVGRSRAMPGLRSSTYTPRFGRRPR